jgi:hypothetical protein
MEKTTKQLLLECAIFGLLVFVPLFSLMLYSWVKSDALTEKYFTNGVQYERSIESR